MADAVPDWFHNTLVDGLTMLLALALPGTPPAETIKLTLQVWESATWPRLAWVEGDVARLQAAFIHLAGTCERWPVPRQLLQALPARPEQPKLAAPELSREQMAANKQRLAALLQQTREALLAKSPPKEAA